MSYSVRHAPHDRARVDEALWRPIFALPAKRLQSFPARIHRTGFTHCESARCR